MVVYKLQGEEFYGYYAKLFDKVYLKSTFSETLKMLYFVKGKCQSMSFEVDYTWEIQSRVTLKRDTFSCIFTSVVNDWMGFNSNSETVCTQNSINWRILLRIAGSEYLVFQL